MRCTGSSKKAERPRLEHSGLFSHSASAAAKPGDFLRHSASSDMARSKPVAYRL